MYTAMIMSSPGAVPVAIEREIPIPGPRQALVRIKSSGLNYNDLLNDRRLTEGPWPRIPLSDGAGEIAELGPEVGEFAVEDRVTLPFYPRWLQGPPTPSAKEEIPGRTRDGHLQQYVCAEAVALVRSPAHLSDREAATLPCAGLTAWSALEGASVQSGDVVVVQGTGGVSMFALQLAKARQATVVSTSSSDVKLETAASLGADHLINYRTLPNWDKEVRAITNGEGADLVVDIGGAQTLGESVRATRMGGTVAIVGGVSGFGSAEIPVAVAMTQNIKLVGVTVGSVADLSELCRTMESKEIRPHISHSYTWEELEDGLLVLRRSEHTGKIAIAIP